jgi:cytochrome P450
LLWAKYAKNWQRGADHDAAMKLLVEERIERHRNGEVLNDLFQPMIESKGGERSDISIKDQVSEVQQAGKKDLEAESASIGSDKTPVGAGSDGPAVSITMTLYNLIRHPRALDNLRAELDAVLDPAEKVVPWSKIKSLPYLRACIDEAMRLTPPVATELIRRTPPSGACIDGRMIPGDTNVSIAAYSAHRDPAVFEDPEEYRPERWIARGSDHLREMLAVFIPFSAGTRGCIGRSVSIVMQTVSLATMVYHFEFALPHATWEMDFEEWFNLWPLEMPMKVWSRKLGVTS